MLPASYACGDTGTVVIQSTPCSTSFYSWAPTLVYPQRVQVGQLYLIVASRVTISEEHLDLSFTLDRNATRNNTFELSFAF